MGADFMLLRRQAFALCFLSLSVNEEAFVGTTNAVAALGRLSGETAFSRGLVPRRATL